jgi:hypothetical protein
MQLFAICLDPQLTNLANVMTSVHIGRRTVKTTVLAYADDVTLLVTSPQDIPRIKTALDQYAAATGARINIKKYRAVAYPGIFSGGSTNSVEDRTERTGL